MSSEVNFSVVLRGYDRRAVDNAVRRVNDALATDDPAVRAQARAELARQEFTVVLRGYDRSQVDSYLRLIAGQLGQPG